LLGFCVCYYNGLTDGTDFVHSLTAGREKDRKFVRIMFGFFEVSLDDGVWGQLVGRGVGKGTAWAASELGALRSIVTGIKGKRASWAVGY
jgi:hypothetical protein